MTVTPPALPRECPSLPRGALARPHGHAGSRTFSSRLTDKTVKDYSVYRSSLLFWALVDLTYNMFKVRTPSEAWWGATRVSRHLCCWL